MAEHLTYGIENMDGAPGRLYAEVPLLVWKRARTSRTFGGTVGRLKNKRYQALQVEEDADGIKVLINDEHIGNSPSKRNQLYGVTNVISMLEAAAGLQRDLQPIRTALGVKPIVRTDCLQGVIELDGASYGTSDEAIDTMLAMAERLNAPKNSIINASIQPERRRFRFQVDDMAYATPRDANVFDGTTIKLQSENLRSHEAQLICLAGVVAVTRTDVLV
jgi:hypothetical protein